MGGVNFMSNQKKVVIQISKEKLDLMKQLGLSAQDVFSKGLQEVLRQKYREFSLLDDDEDEDELEWYDFVELTNQMNDIDRFMAKNNVENN